jgi:hypothetical protein
VEIFHHGIHDFPGAFRVAAESSSAFFVSGILKRMYSTFFLQPFHEFRMFRNAGPPKRAVFSAELRSLGQFVPASGSQAWPDAGLNQKLQKSRSRFRY